MGQCAESVEQHCGELYDQYQREEEDEDKTDRLELQILLRDVYLENHSLIKCIILLDETYFLEKKRLTEIEIRFPFVRPNLILEKIIEIVK